MKKEISYLPLAAFLISITSPAFAYSSKAVNVIERFGALNFSGSSAIPTRIGAHGLVIFSLSASFADHTHNTISLNDVDTTKRNAHNVELSVQEIKWQIHGNREFPKQGDAATIVLDGKAMRLPKNQRMVGELLPQLRASIEKAPDEAMTGAAEILVQRLEKLYDGRSQPR